MKPPPLKKNCGAHSRLTPLKSEFKRVQLQCPKALRRVWLVRQWRWFARRLSNIFKKRSEQRTLDSVRRLDRHHLHAHTHSLTHSLTRARARTHTHTHTHSHTYTHSLTHSLTHTHTLTHRHTLKHSHTRAPLTHSLTHSLRFKGRH